MSKVLMNRVFAKDTFKVLAATITTGWKPGQFFQLNALGEASLATGDNALFMGIDDPTASSNSTLSLAAPPTGSVLTGIYGCGSKVYVDHSTEVAASSAVRCYDQSVENASVGANLWVNALGKLTVTGSLITPVGWPTLSGSIISDVIAKLIQVPSVANNFTVGVLFRF